MSGFYIPSAGGGALFAVCFAAWALFEAWTNLKTWPAGSLNRDQLSRYVIIAAMGVSFMLAMAATWAHAFDLTLARPGIFYLGLALMAAGLVFRAYAIRQLGRYFTPEVTVQPGQRVLDGGLYRYLRHPSYTGTFVTILGFGLALTNGLSLLIMLALPGLAYAYRMRVEESALCAAFGDQYRDYMRRTKRLIPFIY